MSFVIRGLVGAATVAYPALVQAQTVPMPDAPPVSPAPLHVYMRDEGAPLTFTARTESGQAPAQWCVSPSSAYATSGVSLAGASAIFLLVYRTDRASVSFTPDPPLDVRGMPPSARLAGSGNLSSERASIGSTRPGLGLRIAF